MACLLKLAELAEQMAATASRLKKRTAIAEAIAEAYAAPPASDDVSLFALYLAGKPFAESNSRKLLAGRTLWRRV
jgi:DNA ligase-1